MERKNLKDLVSAVFPYLKVRLLYITILFINIANFSYAANFMVESSNSYQPHQKNFYVGAGMGAGINYFTPTNNTVNANNADHASMAYRLFGGYNLDKHFALELGYTNFGYYNNSASGNSICNTSGTCGFPTANPLAGVFNTELNIINTINAFAIDLSTIARYNVTDNLNVFGKFGANYLNASLTTQSIISPQIPIGSTSIGPTINQTTTANSNAILPLLGIGYEYNPNNFLGIRVEYDYYFSVNMINNQSINEGAYSPSALILSTIYNF